MDFLTLKSEILNNYGINAIAFGITSAISGDPFAGVVSSLTCSNNNAILLGVSKYAVDNNQIDLS